MNQFQMIVAARKRIAAVKNPDPIDQLLIDLWSRLGKTSVERDKAVEQLNIEKSKLAQSNRNVRDLSYHNDCLESRNAILQGQSMPIIPCLEDNLKEIL